MGQRFPFGLFGGGGSGSSASRDSTNKVYTAQVVAGSVFIVYGNGAELGRANADGTGKAVVTLTTAPAAGVAISYGQVLPGGTIPTPVQALGPATASFSVGAAAGSLIAAIAGLTGDELLSSIAPNDGRVALSMDRRSLVVGLSASVAGIISYTLTTSTGRPLTILVNVSARQNFTQVGKHYFASNRTRSPVGQGSPNVAGNVYTLHEVYLGTTPYALTEFGAGFPAHYTSNAQGDNEFAAPAAFTLQGAAIGFGPTRAAATWVQLPFIAAGSAAITPSNSVAIDPTVNSVGAYAKALANIPAGSRLWFKTQLYAAGAMIYNYEINGPAGEGAAGSATDSLGARLLDGSLTNTTSGRIASQLYGPSFVTAAGGDGRPVALILGDSIGHGKNEQGANFGIPGSVVGDGGAAGGAYSRGLNDNLASAQWLGANLCIPGTAPNDIATNGRSKTARKWDLVKLAQKAVNGGTPLATHIFIEHGTNGLLATLAEMVAMMKGYYGVVRAEWPGLPLIQGTMICKATTTDGYQTVANQSVGSNDNSTATRFLFNDKLMADRVDGTVDYAINTYQYYADPVQRDRYAVIQRTATLATAIAGSATPGTIAVNENTIQQGDFISLEVDTPGTAGANGGGAHVTGVSGTGPYTLTLNTGITVSAAGAAAGSRVKPHLAADPAGLHPGTTANMLAMKAIVDLKNLLWAA